MNKFSNGNLKNSNLFLFFAIVTSAVVLFFIRTHTQNVILNVLDNYNQTQIENGWLNDIRFYDEVLTNSAMLAARTGETEYEKRYLLCEPKLDSAISGLLQIDVEHDINKTMKMTDIANVDLVAMEHRVFELVRTGKLNEAVEIITGREYMKQKAIYSAGLINFINLHRTENEQQIKLLKKNANRGKWYFGLVILFLAMVWVPVVRFIRKSRAQMLQHNQELQLQIQARKESESALYESKKQVEKAREQLQESIKASGVGLWDWNMQTNEVYQSPEWKKQIGYEDDELQSSLETYISHLHPNYTKHLMETANEFISGKRDKSESEYRFRHKDGSYRWILARASVQYDENGKPLHLLGSNLDITERKNTELMMKELNERFNLVAHATNDCIYDWDLLTNRVWWSEAISRLFDYPLETTETEIYWWEEKIHPDDLDSLMKSIQNVFDAKLENWIGEFRFKRADGSFASVLDRGYIQYDENRNPLRWIGSMMDISERKKSEEQVNMLAHAVKNSADCITITDKDYQIIFVNDSFCEVYGFKEEEIINQPISIINSPNNLPEVSNDLFSSMSKKEIWSGEILNKRKDGTDFMVQLSLSPLLTDKGELIAVVGVLKDITERKQAEETLRAAQQLIEGIINAIPVRIFWKDRNSVYLGCNSIFAHDAGFSDPKDIIGKDDFQMGWRDQAELYRSGDRQVMESGIPILLNEEPQTTPEGNTIIMLTNKILLKNSMGEIYGILGTSMDVTERIAVVQEIELKNEQLQKINAEKDKFFSIIAHDLKSPFNGFLGLTQIMAEELPSLTMAQVQDLAISMKNSATNLYRLLENLLEWSQIQKGSIPFNPAAIQLRSSVDEVLALAIETAKSKDIEISYEIPEDITVFADSHFLQTIIRNLVSNAMKFTNKGGKVNVSAKTTEDRNVEISVQDTGIGMNQTMVENLFRIDVKTNRIGTEGEPSTGLGLLLCKEFVEKNGGKIWAESEVGKGSTFSFTMPVSMGG